MQAMAASPVDVAKEFQSKIEDLSVSFAHALYNHDRNTLVFTTFFDEIESEAEDKLARIEAYMVDTFPEYAIDFHTIHLFGRDLSQFMPEGAMPLMSVRLLAPQRASVS
jgi:hypothetical protein